jgi:hypothetical protein
MRPKARARGKNDLVPIVFNNIPALNEQEDFSFIFLSPLTYLGGVLIQD